VVFTSTLTQLITCCPLCVLELSTAAARWKFGRKQELRRELRMRECHNGVLKDSNN
jgi:hypothetical protein